MKTSENLNSLNPQQKKSMITITIWAAAFTNLTGQLGHDIENRFNTY